MTGETTCTSGDEMALVVDVTLEADCSDRLRLCCFDSTPTAAAAAAVIARCCSRNSWCLAMHDEYTSATFCTTASTKLCQCKHMILDINCSWSEYSAFLTTQFHLVLRHCTLSDENNTRRLTLTPQHRRGRLCHLNDPQNQIRSSVGASKYIL